MLGQRVELRWSTVIFKVELVCAQSRYTEDQPVTIRSLGVYYVYNEGAVTREVSSSIPILLCGNRVLFLAVWAIGSCAFTHTELTIVGTRLRT